MNIVSHKRQNLNLKKVLNVEHVESKRADTCDHQEVHKFVCKLSCDHGFLRVWLWGKHQHSSDSKRRKLIGTWGRHWAFIFCLFYRPLRLSYSHNPYFIGNVAWYLWRPRRTALSDNIKQIQKHYKLLWIWMRTQLESVALHFFFFKEQRLGHNQVRMKLLREDDGLRLTAKILLSSANPWLLEGNTGWQIGAVRRLFFLTQTSL